MLDRIERVSRVKSLESSIDRGFERKEGYNDSKKNKQSFQKTLHREMDKEVRPANEAGIGVPNAYRLELSTRPTQSLFYREVVDLSDIENKINITS